MFLIKHAHSPVNLARKLFQSSEWYLSSGPQLPLHLVQRGEVGHLQVVQGQCGEEADWQLHDQLRGWHVFAQLWVKT